MHYYMNVYRIKERPTQDFIRWACYRTKEQAVEDSAYAPNRIYRKTISVDVDPLAIRDKYLTCIFPNIKFYDYGWSKYL